MIFKWVQAYKQYRVEKEKQKRAAFERFLDTCYPITDEDRRRNSLHHKKRMEQLQ